LVLLIAEVFKIFWNRVSFVVKFHGDNNSVVF
jgi:hypothetical protein